MTRQPAHPVTWPLTIKVPLLVAALIVVVAIIASNVVLMRLSETQETNLRRLTGVLMAGLSTAVMPHVIRKEIWETYDILDRARTRYAGVHAVHIIVTVADGTVLAASNPRAFPVYAPAPTELTSRFPGDKRLVIDDDSGLAWAYHPLMEGDVEVGRIFTEIDISDLIRERHETLLVLLFANTVVTLGFVAMGYWAARRMVRPVSVLSAYVERGRKGKVEVIPPEHLPPPGTEFGTLFRRFNAMAVALDERESLSTRLAEEEKLAQLGKLASGMAHEVNNPLGGMFNVLDTLEKHSDDPRVIRTSLDLLKRGLAGIRNVVRAALVTYKGDIGRRNLTRTDLDDLRYLIQHEVSRRCLLLHWHSDLPEEVPVDSMSTRQAALNLLLNACAASPRDGEVRVHAHLKDGTFRLTVADDGPGLPDAMAALYSAPRADATPPDGNSGLGVWTVTHLVAKMNGRFEVATAPAQGTRITMIIPLDRKAAFDAAA